MSVKGLKIIGRGMFTTCYKLNDAQVKLISCDPVKECMALYGFGDSPLWPEIERVEWNHISEKQAYIMPLYDRPKSLKQALIPEDYALYKWLRSVHAVVYNVRDYDVPDIWRNKFAECPFSDARAALLEAIDSLQNYGYSIRFEISPRNVAVKDSRLILLDCFFFADTLKEVKSKKTKRIY